MNKLAPRQCSLIEKRLFKEGRYPEFISLFGQKRFDEVSFKHNNQKIEKSNVLVLR